MEYKGSTQLPFYLHNPNEHIHLEKMFLSHDHCTVRLLNPIPFNFPNLILNLDSTKSGLFSESAMSFLNLQISKKKYSKKLSWAWNFNFNFRIAFWNIFFLRFGDLKNSSHFLKNSHLYFIPTLLINFIYWHFSWLEISSILVTISSVINMYR